MVVILLSVFLLGALTVIAMEAVGLWILIRLINERVAREQGKEKDFCFGGPPQTNFRLTFRELRGRFSMNIFKGAIWVLEPEKVPKPGLLDKVPKEQKRKKDYLEVIPVQKYAKIKDRCLILTEADGSHVEISLRGCTIAAVSATNLSSRKWAKRYPIKVESKGSVIYKGSKIIYIYLETSWEKESWCKALRLASCDEEKLKWFTKLNLEFHNYLTSLNAGYPSFMKPSGVLSAEPLDKPIKFDGSSKVRQFLKKLTKKGSKSGVEYIASGTSTSGREERKLSEKSRSIQDSVLAPGLVKMVPTGKRSRGYISGISDVESDHKSSSDEGTLCLNLLISRLFFDAKRNLQIRNSIRNRIQRALSHMRSPNYLGEVTCTSVDPGTLPPHILAMRVLPSDTNELWALEVDLEYSGGMVLEIETRLEIRELELEGEQTSSPSSSVGEVTSDLLEGFEYFGKQLKLSEETTDGVEQKDQGDTILDEIGNSKSTTSASSQVSRWKSIVQSITKQVQQVPISLGVRVSTFRGTMRMYVKAPPSDQIWFGFTSMPNIEFNLESFVGDHKITNGHVAVFLISRFKAAIRETLVLPNCESVCIPCMSAEKDDWVPMKVAPFMWHNQDNAGSSTPKQEAPSFQPGDEKSKSVGHATESTSQSLDPSHVGSSTLNDHSFQEKLRAPLLDKDTSQDIGPRTSEEKQNIHLLPSQSLILAEGQNDTSEEDDTSRPRRLGRLGTKERMLGLGKKMGEKLEVRRRHIEEKGRSFVDRMRGT
ncbi:putative integral membrane protein conserved region [Forsythia ovata]|uniref:Integral membrane protein conserved region n=1 Tax=Forsythia ovata TaxID=205694 RepID=A0ABD1WUJ6_9LAMI